MTLRNRLFLSTTRLGLGLGLTLLGAATMHAKQPENLGLGLRQMATDYRATRTKGAKILDVSQFSALKTRYPLARTDPSNRVMVDVYLDGTRPLDEMVKAAEALGCSVTTKAAWYRQGAFSALLPLDQAARLGRTRGVNTVNLSLRPKTNVGLATSQGTTVLKSTAVNALGYRGAGITVGVLSGSFDTAKYNTDNPPRTNATQDAANDDLPGVGSASNPAPVNVLQDYGSASAPYEDEGRAMCQIIHDLAPAANLAYATALESEIGFANNIIALAGPTDQTYELPSYDPATGEYLGTQTVHGANCQVICDDVTYAEPAFSDGIIAQAVDQVVTQRGVTYFSSAGNDSNNGYEATYNPVTNNGVSQALLASEGGISPAVYSSIPQEERDAIESFHGFATNAAGQPILVQKFFLPKYLTADVVGILGLFWDDPTDVTTGGVNAVTTDFDILIFRIDSDGTVTYQPDISGTDNSYATNQALEVRYGVNSGTQYEAVLVRTKRTPGAGITANQATHIFWGVSTNAQGWVADFATPKSSFSFGHPYAAGCNCMAAYVYDNNYNAANPTYVPAIESYSANGPRTIYFDAAGHRLATPVVRKKPDFAAVDGVDTSFFGSDSDGNGLPNFFGTSAASPHGAACAALLLSAAKVNGITLSPADIRSLLASTTQGVQDQNPAESTAASGPVSFDAFDRNIVSDQNMYTVTFNGAAGITLSKLVFDLRPVDFRFDTGLYPVTPGGHTVGVNPALPTFSSELSNLDSGSTTVGATETLTFSNFNPGDTVSFGVATLDTARNYRNGDDLAGTTFTATLGDGSTYTGTLANKTGRKWNFKSGYGLIDVNAAVARLLGR